jgi:thiamine-phosphate pyrophosphorylase
VAFRLRCFVVHGLYAIVDSDFLSSRGIDLVPFAEAVLRARPALLQVRAKNEGAKNVLGWLRALRGPSRQSGTLLFANDRPDLAVLAGCDGVHVGQDDVSVADVRRFAPGLRIGISTHDAGQLAAALDEGPDYVAFGPVFATSSKAGADPVVGVDALREASLACRGRGIPLVAIGGIDVSRAAVVAAHADVAAVISALLPDEGMSGVTARAATLQAALALRS